MTTIKEIQASGFIARANVISRLPWRHPHLTVVQLYIHT